MVAWIIGLNLPRYGAELVASNREDRFPKPLELNGAANDSLERIARRERY
jgi:hypothetical protein